MGRRDRARADHVGALTGFCSARRRRKRTGDRQGWNQSFGSGGAQDELQYRGQLDASRVTPVANARRDLFEAMKQIAETVHGLFNQVEALTDESHGLPAARARLLCHAYIAGSLGTLIGADLTNLSKVRGLGAPVASIGGAGTFDGIFLTGILAVLLASLYARPRAAHAG